MIAISEIFETAPIISFVTSILNFIAIRSIFTRQWYSTVEQKEQTQFRFIAKSEETWLKRASSTWKGISRENHPPRQTFNRIVQSFCDTGGVHSLGRNQRKIVIGEQSEIAGLAAAANDPRICCRQIERHSDIPETSVLRVVNSIRSLFLCIGKFVAPTFRIASIFPSGSFTVYRERKSFLPIFFSPMNQRLPTMRN